MNFGNRFGFVRWATAAIVAAGAITFVASEGFSGTLWAAGSADVGGNCNLGSNYGMYGNAQAMGADGTVVCDVGAAITAGTTNYAQSFCGWPGWPQPTFVWGRVINVNKITGVISATVCAASEWSWWPNTSGCSGWFGSCHAAVTAYGVN